MNNAMLESASNGKLRSGKKELLKHLKGERITRSQAVKAHCYDCSGMGEQKDCEIEECALLPFSPYRNK